MTPIKHPYCNDSLRPPEGVSEEECGTLHILREDDYVASFWQPNADELQALAAGGCIILQVRGVTHPPLGLGVLKPITTNGG